jgi:hypothetical protein
MASTGQQSAQEGAQLFNLALPGLEKATSYYGKLSTGDPNALARANAPAIQQITGQTNAAKQNIMGDNPRGGERTLALEEADINKGAQISQLTTGSYLGSFPSLAQLGGQNVSQGTAATGTGLQGMNAAANQYGQLQQLSNEQKATQLGFITSLAGAGAGLATMCWIAAVYWGDWYDPRTVMVRAYLMQQYARRTFVGTVFVPLYRRYGKSASKNGFVLFALRPLFNWFLAQAERRGYAR